MLRKVFHKSTTYKLPAELSVMKPMNMNLLDQRIKEKLGGNENRIVELFHNEVFFNELVATGRDGDWLHYEPKTFDGWYFV